MKKLLLVGGDRRAFYLAELLEKAGYPVETLGLRKQEKVQFESADAVLFPYPHSVKNGSIPALTDEKLKPETILKQLREDALIIAGKGLEGYVSQESPQLKRYSDVKTLEKRNADLSAEAAVCEAMLHCSTALMDAAVLITGYGLFGRAAALRMKSLGASVWIAARREAQRKQAQEDGMNTVSILEMENVIPQMNLILNTVPARIFGEYHLKQIPAGCWLLELASAPYGFDADTARALGVLCAVLPGLPGRYAPLSAAKALLDAVTELIREEG